MQDHAARRPYHHGDLKNALVLAGIDILETDGLPALSLRAIAARVGVSHTAPKNHFGSLRGLLTAIATEGFCRHAAFMQAGVSDLSEPQARLHAAMEGYVRFASDHPALFSLMFSKEHCEMTDPALRMASAESYAVLAGIARGLDWDKADAPNAQRRTELLLWSIVHGYAELSIAGFAGENLPIAAIMPDFRYRA
jgi:AcrR family transcriptional regulator